MTPPLRVRIAVIAALTLMSVLPAVTATAQTQSGQAQSGQAQPQQTMARDARGQQAIDRLGGRLPAVAKAHGLAPAELRAELREDDALWVDTTDRLYYVEPVAPAEVVIDQAPLDGPFPLADTFLLHSNPGADRVVHLDFDGAMISGTAWDAGSPYYASAYSMDGDEAFNDTELARIQSVWQRVAEDFAPFNVDVTTQDPGFDAINRNGAGDTRYGTRALITSTTNVECSCGGVAYVGVFDEPDFHSYYQPAFVYTRGVGTGPHNVAEATSHEIGHNLGLRHDGTASSGYYVGHGDWAPIMGVGYYEPITQWSRGEYAGANNREDDYVVMQANGAPLKADDHPGTTDLGSGPALLANGLIHAPTDVDTFTFTSGAGEVTIDISPSAVSPDLDVRAELRNGSGTLIASADPPSGSISDDVATGMGAAITATVPAGTYTLTVDGVGKGDPLSNGYSDYGSLGFFSISGTIPSGGTGNPTPPAAPTNATASLSGSVVTVSFTDNSANETGFEFVRERQQKRKWVVAGSGSVGPNVTTFTDSPGTGTFRYVIVAVNGAGSSGSTTSNSVRIRA